MAGNGNGDFPPFLWNCQWLRLSEYAKIHGKSASTIFKQIKDGTWSGEVCQDPVSHYWYVKLDDLHYPPLSPTSESRG